jgi:hypothetical protein
MHELPNEIHENISSPLKKMDVEHVLGACV